MTVLFEGSSVIWQSVGKLANSILAVCNWADVFWQNVFGEIRIGRNHNFIQLSNCCFITFTFTGKIFSSGTQLSCKIFGNHKTPSISEDGCFLDSLAFSAELSDYDIHDILRQKLIL